MTLDGAPPVAPERRPFVALTTVSRGYLETMRIPLRRGRALVDGDFRDGLPVPHWAPLQAVCAGWL